LDYRPASVHKGWAMYKQFLKHAEKMLEGKTTCVGNSYTIADIVLVSAIQMPFFLASNEKDRKEFPNLMKWLEGCSKQSWFQPSKLRFNKQAFKLPKLGNHDAPKDGAAKEPKSPKKKQEPKSPKKKNEKKEQEKKQEEPKEEKKPEPNFPETTLNLFNFKTEFVNLPRADAMKVFWEKYDPKGYTCWYLKYDKLPSECKVLYMTNNLMQGFLSRCEKIAKNCFGYHGIYGDEPNLEIRGVWMIRGLELFDEIKEHDMYDYYAWEKLDV